MENVIQGNFGRKPEVGETEHSELAEAWLFGLREQVTRRSFLTSQASIENKGAKIFSLIPDDGKHELLKEHIIIATPMLESIISRSGLLLSLAGFGMQIYTEKDAVRQPIYFGIKDNQWAVKLSAESYRVPEGAYDYETRTLKTEAGQLDYPTFVPEVAEARIVHVPEIRFRYDVSWDHRAVIPAPETIWEAVDEVIKLAHATIKLAYQRVDEEDNTFNILFCSMLINNVVTYYTLSINMALYTVHG